jgi:hypothetical protein
LVVLTKDVGEIPASFFKVTGRHLDAKPMEAPDELFWNQ